MKKKVLIITIAVVLILAGIAAFAIPALMQGMKAGELRKDPMKYLIYAGSKVDLDTPKSVEISVDKFLIPDQLEYFLSSVGLTAEKASEIISKFTLYFAASNVKPNAEGENPMFRYKGLVKYDADDLISFDFTMAKRMFKLDFAPLFNLNMVSKLEENAPGSEEFEKGMKLISKYLDFYKLEKDEVKRLLEDKEIDEALRAFFRSVKLVGTEKVSVGGNQVSADRIEMDFTLADIQELAMDFMELLGRNATLRGMVEKKFDAFVDTLIKDKDYELFGLQSEAEVLEMKTKFREQLDGLKDQVAYMRASTSQITSAFNPKISAVMFIHDNKIKRSEVVLVLDAADESYDLNDLFLQFRIVSQEEPSFTLPSKMEKNAATIEVNPSSPNLSKEDTDKVKNAIVEGLKNNKAFEKVVNTVSEVTGYPITKDMIIHQLEMQLQMMIENGVNNMNF